MNENPKRKTSRLREIVKNDPLWIVAMASTVATIATGNGGFALVGIILLSLDHFFGSES